MKRPAATAVVAELLSGLPASIEPPPSSLGYRLGVAASAVTLVTLLVVYLGLVAAAGYGLWWHASTHVAWLDEHGHGAVSWVGLAYLGGLFIGGVFFLFLVKPILARRGDIGGAVELERVGEPVLFAFIDRVARSCGAPPPRRVLVGPAVTAAAFLDRGLLDVALGRCSLFVGLPLLAFFDTRQVAGVLAHEFGHFRQGAGMRLDYLVQTIGGWFGRAANDDDDWDAWLVRQKAARPEVDLFVVITQGLIWSTRKLLWLFHAAGALVSSSIRRHNEREADHFALAVAGSHGFERIFRQLELARPASEWAEALMAHRFDQEVSLPDDLPALVVAKMGDLPKDVRGSIAAARAEQRTGFFDFHPSQRERIEWARLADQEPLAKTATAATALIDDYPWLCRRATLIHYRAVVSPHVDERVLVPTARFLEEAGARSAELDATVRCMQGVWPDGCVVPLAGGPTPTGEAARQALEAARAALVREAPLAREAAGKASTAVDALAEALHQQLAGQVLPPEEGAPRPTALRSDADDARSALIRSVQALEPFHRRAVSRLACCFVLAQEPEAVAAGRDALALLGRLSGHATELRLVQEHLMALASLQQLGAHVETLAEAPQLRPNLAAPTREHAAGLARHLASLRKALADVSLPFAVAGGHESVGRYLVADEPDVDDPVALAEAGGAAWRLYVGLVVRLLGTAARAAEDVERALGLPALPAPPRPPAEA